jgi:hypothetical protein
MMSDMTDPEDVAAADQSAAVVRNWREQALGDSRGFAILDRAEMDALLATDPTPDEVQAWLKSKVTAAEAQREALAHLDPDAET